MPRRQSAPSAPSELDDQRTSTVAPVVRGFKIDGDEGGRGRGRSGRGVGTLAYGSVERNLRDSGYGKPRWLW